MKSLSNYLYYHEDNPSIDLYCGDCLEIMPYIEKESVDLVVTSPPYNVNKEYENWSSDEEYERFIDLCIGELPRILKPAGRVAWNILGSITAKGRIYSPLLPSWNSLEKCLKFRDFIIWNQLNSENDTAWGSWASASAPHFRHQCELILVYFKESWEKGKGKSDIPPQKFPEWTRDIWNIAVARREWRHPTPFPIKLAERIITLLTFINDSVLDPLVGSGTTLLSCKLLNRKGIGIEISEEYCKMAKQRLKNVPLRLL